jgi:uncharacterized protein
MAGRSCGACTLCCRLLGVPELEKPAGEWCAACTRGAGCGRYADRPPSCRAFECFWLLDEGFPDELRPDRCGVVIAFDAAPDAVVLHVDPDRPDALAAGPAEGVVPVLLDHYRRVAIVCGEERAVIERAPDAHGGT